MKKPPPYEDRKPPKVEKVKPVLERRLRPWTTTGTTSLGGSKVSRNDSGDWRAS